MNDMQSNRRSQLTDTEGERGPTTISWHRNLHQKEKWSSVTVQSKSNSYKVLDWFSYYFYLFDEQKWRYYYIYYFSENKMLWEYSLSDMFQSKPLFSCLMCCYAIVRKDPTQVKADVMPTFGLNRAVSMASLFLQFQTS